MFNPMLFNQMQRQMAMRKSDTSEKILINGLSLLKMLKHARQGIPLEVIGILLGRKIDEYTIEIFDVFSTPQTATGANVETTEESFQAIYMELLQRTGYDNLVSVGWYHSHPGFDVWLSSVDTANQKTMEAADPDHRAVAIVVDPVLSAKGKVVIGAFRNIPRDLASLMMSDASSLRIEDPREKTSFIGHTCEFRPTTAVNGLNVTFYQMPIEFKMNPTELNMLSSLHRPQWSKGFQMNSFEKNDIKNLETIKSLSKGMKAYRNDILREANMKSEEAELAHVGKIDPKLFLKQTSDALASSQAALMSVLHIDKQAF